MQGSHEQEDMLLLLPAGNMELLQGLGLQSLRYSMDFKSSTAGPGAPADAAAATAAKHQWAQAEVPGDVKKVCEVQVGQLHAVLGIRSMHDLPTSCRLRLHHAYFPGDVVKTQLALHKHNCPADARMNSASQCP